MTGTSLYRSPGALAIGLGLLVVAALVALVRGSPRRRSPGVARLGFVALVLFVVGIVNGGDVPTGVDAIRINLYRWTWALALLAWTALGIGLANLASLVVDKSKRSGVVERAVNGAPIVLLLAIAVITASIAVSPGPNAHNREVPDFRAEKRVVAAVFAHVDRTRPVYVTSQGSDAILSIAPYVIFRLVRAGLDVEVSAYGTSTAGIGHAYRPKSNPTTVVISSGKAEQPSGAGRLIAIEPFGPGRTAQYDELAATRTRMLNDLASQALGQKVALAPDADARIGALYSGVARLHIDQLITGLPTDPLRSFEDPGFLNLVAMGILRSPLINRAEVQRLVLLPPYRYRGTYGDEQVQVHLLDPP